MSELQARAIAEKLFLDQGWLSLVHYKPTLFGGYHSQADDVRFFNAEDGDASPEDELLATLASFFAYDLGDIDAHPQCRFPARYYWLNSRLHFDAEKLRKVECPKLDEWRNTLKPHSLDLIFPSAYLNGPSSMFGHTLLRVNSQDFRKELPLVAYALNYAADADATDSAFVFSIKGLIGGYPGIFSIVPYYEKLNEYRDIENRDIWEYSLNFTHDEVMQMMRHAWELRNITFDYYYITENCSYHMLSLMETARPGLKLTEQFDSMAVPIDTVRTVIDAGLVEKINYRPSTTTVIEHHALELDANENELVVALSNSQIQLESQQIKSLSPDNYARVLEQAYDYSRFLSTDNPSVRDSRAKQNWALLTARSEAGVKDIWREIAMPSVSPDKAHETARVAVGMGRLEDASFVSLKLRPAYHDMTDPVVGYVASSQINFFDLQIRYFDQSEKTELDKFSIVNVLSLSPQTEYFSPISWGVDVAVERVNSLQGRINVAQLTVDGGLSYPVGDSWVISGLAEAKVKASDKLDKGYSAGLGLRLNLLTQNSNYSSQLRLVTLAFRAGEKSNYHLAAIEHSVHLDTNLSMRLVASRLRDYAQYSTQAELFISWYF